MVDADRRTREERLEEVRWNARNCVCHRCKERVSIHEGGHVTSMAYVPAIADAVEHANRHPSNTERNGDLRYVVEDGLYPDDYSHLIDLSEVPEELRESASIQITGALAKRGIAVNSVRWEPPQLHMMAVADMAYDYYGGER